MTSGLVQGKRVVITGGGRGLGRALALACAREGADVVVCYRDRREAAVEVAREIAESHGRVSAAVALDLADPASIERGVEEAVSALGGLDAWVNNAGDVLPGVFVASEPERLIRAIATNLTGPMLCARAAILHMLRKKSGVILSVSSVSAIRPTRGQAAYAAAKGGIEAMTRALAVEYAKKGIRAVCLRPGAIDTEMPAATRALAEDEVMARVPQRRVATAAEVAEQGVFLLSDRSAYVTGAVVTVDGGYVVG